MGPPIMGPSPGMADRNLFLALAVLRQTCRSAIFTVSRLRHESVSWNETKKDFSMRFEWFGFTALAVGRGSLQIALDRGETRLGWRGIQRNQSSEFIRLDRRLSIISLRAFADDPTGRSFSSAVQGPPNFGSGCVVMAVMAWC